MRMQHIEFSHSTITYNAPVISIVFKLGAKMGVPEAREMIVVAEKLSENKPYLILSDIRNHVDITPEARKVAASKREAPLVVANAVLTNNIALKLTSNLFIIINKPHFPVKVFTDKDKAIHWLKKFDPEK
jgi:hypothetical protein